MALLNKVYFSRCSFSSSLPLSCYTWIPRNPTSSPISLMYPFPTSSFLIPCFYPSWLSPQLHVTRTQSQTPSQAHVWGKTHGFVFWGLGHLTWHCFPDPAIFQKISSFLKGEKIPLHIWATFFAIHLSVDCHLGWSQFLVITNKQITV